MKRFHIHVGVTDLKAWFEDPSGLAWEAYQNMADAEVFSEKEDSSEASACCAPGESESQASCC